MNITITRQQLVDKGACGANLREANLRWADLRWADLSGADLSEANLSGADLSGAARLSTDTEIPDWTVSAGRLVFA